MLLSQPPPPHLRPWLDSLVQVALPAGLAQSRFPALAMGMFTARFGPGDRVQLHLHSASTRPTVHHNTGLARAVGLLVRPGALACLLDAGPGLCTDQVLDWADVAGPSAAARLAQQLAEAGHDTLRLGLLVQAFDQAMGQALQGRRAGRDVHRAQLCEAVGAAGLAAAPGLGLGERQLQRRCQAWLGLSPKRLHRLLRLQQVLSAALRPQAPATQDLVHQGGFFDQSHLARELRLLGGAPLAQLLNSAHAGAGGWALAAHRQLQASQTMRHPPDH